jgi:integrase
MLWHFLRPRLFSVNLRRTDAHACLFANSLSTARTHQPWAPGLEKRVYPHLFRHQLITYLTKQGIISSKLQLLSGHTLEQSLAVYRALALSDVAQEYEMAMRTFPVR